MHGLGGDENGSVAIVFHVVHSYLNALTCLQVSSHIECGEVYLGTKGDTHELVI
jgi:hypothetical protein